jgi:acetylornithine deacetylase/succinyl-diaminopimelate desuccinylase-like protein
LTRRVEFLLLAGFLFATMATAQSGIDVVRAYRHQHETAILLDFVALFTDPNRAHDTEDIDRAAAYIRDQLQDVGVISELLRVDGVPPIVYGELIVPGATRTLGLNVHYDGQSVDPSQWTHPPFEPTLYTAAMEAGGQPRPLPCDGEAVDPEWRIYARSAGDDKAPIARSCQCFVLSGRVI